MNKPLTLFSLLKKRYFQKLIISFTFFLLIPTILVGTISFRISQNSLLNEVNENNHLIIQQISSSMEATLKEIDNSAIQLINNIYLKDILRLDDIGSYLDIVKLMKMMQNMENTNSIIQSVYIYKNFDNSIIASSFGMADLDGFYDNSWMQLVKLNEEELMENKILWLDTRSIRNATGEELRNVITIVRPIIINGQNKGLVVVNIDEVKLLHTLNNIKLKDGSRVFILNSDGIVISNEDKEKISTRFFDENNPEMNTSNLLNDKHHNIIKYEDIRYITSTMQSEYNQWLYTLMVCEDEYLKPGWHIRDTTVIISIISILLGTIIAFSVSKKMYRPVNDIINGVMQSTAVERDDHTTMQQITNEFEYIKMWFNEISVESKKMEILIDTNHDILVETYFKLLLQPEAGVSLDETRKKLKNLGVVIESGEYIVFVIETHPDWKEDENRNKSIFSLFFNFLKNDGYSIISIRMNQQAVFVLSNNTMPRKKVVNDLSILHDEITMNLDVPHTIGIGSISEYDSLHISYQEAQKALQRKFLEGLGRVYDEIYETNNDWEYRTAIDKIITNIKLSNSQTIETLLKNLVAEIKSKKISYEKTIQAYFNLYIRMGLVIEDSGKAAEEVLDPRSVFYEDIKKLNTIDELNHYMIKKIESANIYLSEHKAYKGSEIINKVVAYIEEKYCEPITLNEIADIVSITPTYLGILFREDKGCTFLQYLTNIRIEKAKQLLSTTDTLVNAIGKKVGYESEQTFIRNFKKLTGLTPNQYRVKNSKLGQ